MKDLENGNHKLIMNDESPDYQMEMTCNDGYVINGVKTVMCDATKGIWTNGVPSLTKCESMYLYGFVDIHIYTI